MLFGVPAFAQAEPSPPPPPPLELQPAPQPPRALEPVPLKSKSERYEYVTPVPAGFHAESRPRIGLLVGGLLVLAGGYFLSAIGAELNHQPIGFAPFIGAFGLVAQKSAGGPIDPSSCSPG